VVQDSILEVSQEGTVLAALGQVLADARTDEAHL
jgi:hypothetical protein